jgi:hypothetical protein
MLAPSEKNNLKKVLGFHILPVGTMGDGSYAFVDFLFFSPNPGAFLNTPPQ